MHFMSKTNVYLLFDERMALHRPVPSTKRKYPDEETDKAAPFENSSRIKCLYQKMIELERRLLYENHENLMKARRFIPLQPDPCDRETIELVHSREHFDRMLMTSQLNDQQLVDLTVDDDLYFCRDTFLAASLACGGVVKCVDHVMNSDVTRAIALVRPPGHHATRDQAMGM
jgi:acetoin utilization deacetylase AcuC-like enzyme